MFDGAGSCWPGMVEGRMAFAMSWVGNLEREAIDNGLGFWKTLSWPDKWYLRYPIPIYPKLKMQDLISQNEDGGHELLRSSSRAIPPIVTSVSLLPPILPIPLAKKQQTQKQTEARNPNREIPRTTEPQQDILGIPTPALDVAIDRAREAEGQRNAVIDDRVDETGGDALVLLGHGVGEDERGGGETHVHAPGDHDRADEGLRPVGLGDGRGGDEDGADCEGGERDCHHPSIGWRQYFCFQGKSRE